MHHSDSVRSYFDEGTEENENKQHKYQFNVNDINRKEEKIQNAELHLFKQYQPNGQGRPRSAMIQIDIINMHNERVISSRIVSVHVHGWLRFPVTKIVKRWVRKRKNNKGLQVRIRNIGDDKNNVKFGTKNTLRREPMLVVFTKRVKGSSLAALLNGNGLNILQNNEKKKRVKRTIVTMNDDKPNNHIEHHHKDGHLECQLKPLRINTRNMGFGENIINPTEININQCVGSCPARIKEDFLNNRHTSHAIFQAIVADSSRPGATHDQPALPCCSPSEFKDEVMIISGRKGSQELIQLVKFEKLIATKCACL
uniref:TGF-beta family profile domain-containing protein n=2 Tax=Clytia hemisphaerica TaxID=252671 RepID=A0A7M5VFS2_9CNID|eukprot:TCONS_00002859-protein